MKEKINNVISLIGSKFGFDAHYYAKNSFWLLAGQVMMSITAFLTTIFLANYVSKHDVGDFRLIISLYAVLSFFTLSGVSASFVRSIVNGQDGALAQALAIKKRYGLFAFAIGTLVAAYFGILKDNPVFAASIFIMSASLPLIESYSIYTSYLQAKHEFKYSSLNTGLVKLIGGIAVIIAAYLSPSTIYLVLAFYLSQVIFTYFQFKILIRKFPPRNSIEDPEMLSYAKHTSLSGVFYMLFGQLDKFILYHFFGPVALASYWIASTIPQEAGRVLSTVLQVAYPKFVKGNHEDLKESISKKLLTLTFVLLVISLLYSLIAYPFFHLFFPEYVSEVSKSIVLMFAFAVIPHYFVWQYFTAKRNIKVVYMSSAIDPTLQAVLYILLIPFFGIWGLVFATLIKTICMNLLAWYSLKNF